MYERDNWGKECEKRRFVRLQPSIVDAGAQRTASGSVRETRWEDPGFSGGAVHGWWRRLPAQQRRQCSCRRKACGAPAVGVGRRYPLREAGRRLLLVGCPTGAKPRGAACAHRIFAGWRGEARLRVMAEVLGRTCQGSTGPRTNQRCMNG